jgi:hypothetical protein
MASTHYDVEALLEEVIHMESRVGQMQTERLDLEQRVLVAQQQQAAFIAPPPPAAAEELIKAEEARLRRQLEGVRAQVKVKETELANLLENDPRAALVVQVQQGVDKYVGDSRRLRKALHEQSSALGGGTPRAAAVRTPVADLEAAQLRAQAQQANAELVTLREQTKLVGSEAAQWEAQAAELRATLARAGAPAVGAGAGTSLAQLEAAEALAEQRHRLRLSELEREQTALQAQLEHATRRAAAIAAELPQYAGLDSEDAVRASRE